jgi:hypothetical protein
MSLPPIFRGWWSCWRVTRASRILPLRMSRFECTPFIPG